MSARRLGHELTRGDSGAIAVAATNHEAVLERAGIATGQNLAHETEHAVDVVSDEISLHRDLAQHDGLFILLEFHLIGSDILLDRSLLTIERGFRRAPRVAAAATQPPRRRPRRGRPNRWRPPRTRPRPTRTATLRERSRF